jgi:hypothetical protein
MSCKEILDCSDRLRQACNGHPSAEIPWPHRLLHEAAQEIDHLRAQVESLKAALNDIKRHQETVAGDAWSKGGAWHIADKALREENK